MISAVISSYPDPRGEASAEHLPGEAPGTTTGRRVAAWVRPGHRPLWLRQVTRKAFAASDWDDWRLPRQPVAPDGAYESCTHCSPPLMTAPPLALASLYDTK